MIRSFTELAVLILTGGFGIYGLLHDFRTDGRITKAGRIAVFGFSLCFILTIVSFGVRMWQEEQVEMRATEQLLRQSERHEELLRKSLSLHYSLATSEITVKYMIRNVSKTRPDLVQWFEESAINGNADTVTNGQIHMSDIRAHPKSPLYVPKLVLVFADAPMPLEQKIIPHLFEAHSSGLLAIYLTPEDSLSSRAGYEKTSDYVYLDARYRTRIHTNTSGLHSLLDFTESSILGVAFPSPSYYKAYTLDEVQIRHPNGNSVVFGSMVPVPEKGDFLTISTVLRLTSKPKSTK